MSRTDRVTRRGAWVVAAVVLAGAACQEDRAVVVEPFGPASYDFNVAPARAGLPAGSVTLTIAGADSSVVLSLRNLRALGAGVYQFWSAADDGTATPAFGEVIEYTTDGMGGVVATSIAASADTYGGSDAADSVQVVVSSTDAANAVNAYLQHAMLVSLEGAAATAPSAAQFLWRRHGVGGDGGLTFGTFGGPDVANEIAANDYVFPAAGSGRAGIRGPEISVDFTNVARPPVGFYYAGYIVDSLGAGVLVDTLRSAYSGVTSESRVSLFDADVNDLLPSVVEDGIRASQVRNCVAGSNTRNCANTLSLSGTPVFGAFVSFVLAVEPKGAGAGMGPGQSHAGTVPEVVREGT